jgi:hypothetical protein
MLPRTAQERLQRAIEQHKTRIDREFDQRIQDEVRRRIEESVIPHWVAKENEYNQVIRSRRGLMGASMFRKMKAALHEDLVQGDHNKRRARECFTFINDNEVALVGETERPTSGSSLPRTWAEWEEARRQAAEARRAARATRQPARRERV